MQPRLRFLISGVLAAIVFGAGYFVAVVVPGAGDTTVHDYTSFYASDSRMTAASLLFVALIAGSLLMLWFFTELRAQLPDSLLVRIAYGAAIVGVIALPVGASILGGPAGAQTERRRRVRWRAGRGCVRRGRPGHHAWAGDGWLCRGDAADVDRRPSERTFPEVARHCRWRTWSARPGVVLLDSRIGNRCLGACHRGHAGKELSVERCAGTVFGAADRPRLAHESLHALPEVSGVRRTLSRYEAPRGDIPCWPAHHMMPKAASNGTDGEECAQL